MRQPIRLGIVGCGEAAQIIHLPSLRRLPDHFRVTALCDVSPKVLNGVGEQWNIAGRHLDHGELLARPDVDAVLIANPHLHHKEVALAALAAGKHAMIEKPVCLTLEELDELIRAQGPAGVTVQVGFMRRYAPAFTEAVRLVGELDQIRLARVHDVIGQNALIIRQIATVIRGDDLPATLALETKRRQDRIIAETIGTDDPSFVMAYAMLLGLSSHDVSAMRELLGVPRRVLFAEQRCEGRALAAAFDYGDFVCQFESTVDRVPRFDGHLEVFGLTRTIRVQYDTPYVRNLPTRLIVTEARGEGGCAVSEITSSWEDAFVIEWRAFHDNIRHRRTPKTSLEDARHDLELFRDMIELMQHPPR